jgi:hypothetical protein
VEHDVGRLFRSDVDVHGFDLELPSWMTRSPTSVLPYVDVVGSEKRLAVAGVVSVKPFAGATRSRPDQV